MTNDELEDVATELFREITARLSPLSDDEQIYVADSVTEQLVDWIYDALTVTSCEHDAKVRESRDMGE